MAKVKKIDILEIPTRGKPRAHIVFSYVNRPSWSRRIYLSSYEWQKLVDAILLKTY